MYLVVKRFFDLVFSFIALLILAPIFIPIIIALKFSGDGDVFYLQERVGKNNKLFSMYKFVTMVRNSLNLGSKTITMRNDPRITKVGKFLRFTKINELPQIINVFTGEMSFVGPRPLLTTSVVKFTKEVQEILYKNKPGITGIGSLVFRDEEKLVSLYSQSGDDPMNYYRQHIYPYKGALEMWYYQNNSFWVDLKILLLTALSVVNSRSELVFKWFKGLPNRPVELTVQGVDELVNTIKNEK